MTGADRRAALRRAGMLVDAGRACEAAAIYGQVLREEPDDVQALCGLSRCLGKLGMAGEGLELAGRAAALAPADDWPHRLRSAHLLLLGRPRPALEAARTALAQDPAGFATLLSLFQAQASLRDARGAGETAGRMLERHPAEPESHNAVGRAAMLRRDWRAADAAFREALRLAPQESVYQSNLALALERRGRRREAMRHFRWAVQADPANPTVRRQFVQAIDRRLALAGAGAGLAAGAVLDLLLRATAPLVWIAGGTLAAVAVAGAVAVRCWRLRQLDEGMRALYRAERRSVRRLRRRLLLGAGAILVAYLGLVGAVAWLSGSLLLTAAAAFALMLLLHYPGMRLWRERVLPVLQARHRAVRAR